MHLPPPRPGHLVTLYGPELEYGIQRSSSNPGVRDRNHFGPGQQDILVGAAAELERVPGGDPDLLACLSASRRHHGHGVTSRDFEEVGVWPARALREAMLGSVVIAGTEHQEFEFGLGAHSVKKGPCLCPF